MEDFEVMHDLYGIVQVVTRVTRLQMIRTDNPEGLFQGIEFRLRGKLEYHIEKYPRVPQLTSLTWPG